MRINVPLWARGHFWAFHFKPPCKPGDPIMFYFDDRIVAKATVFFIESPNLSECEGTGRFRDRWKVFWGLDRFQDLRN